MIKRLTLIVLIITYTVILSGCNTMHGLGKDIESVGEAMTESAKK